MRYTLAGGQPLILTDQDFVAEGGEGKIYVQGQWAYKIYSDLNTMIPLAKMQALAALDHPSIIRPQQLIFNAQQHAVGFSMVRVTHAVGLARLFTNDFCQRHRIGQQQRLTLLSRMMATIQFIHDQQCLMVDGNELNYLVSEYDWQTPYFIDVDSYQTLHFPATALMPSIKDYHSSTLSPLSDWFAFAIIACQVLIGLHPFKGKHPDFNKHDLAARMQANVSIFNPKVTVPAATRDFRLIPPPLIDWFIALFERGERTPPPAVNAQAHALLIAPVSRPTLKSSQQLQIKPLHSYPDPIRQHFGYHGTQLVLAGDQAYINQKAVMIPYQNSVLAFEQKYLIPLALAIVDRQLHVFNLATQTPVPVNLQADHLLQQGPRVYAVAADRLITLNCVQLNGGLQLAPGTQWQIMPQAHQVLNGLIYQNVLGQPWLVIPWQANACMMQAVPELSGYHIIHGRHENGVAMLIGQRQGRYDQLIFRFSNDYRHYDLHRLENCELLDNNFVTLDNGTVVQLAQDGELILFHRQADSQKVLHDAQLSTTMQLTHEAMRVLFYTDKTLYQMTMN